MKLNSKHFSALCVLELLKMIISLSVSFKAIGVKIMVMLFVLLSQTNCCGQDIMPPPIQSLEIKPPKTVRGPMEYKFPDVVETVLKEKLQHEKGSKNFLVFDYHGQDTVYLYLYSVRDHGASRKRNDLDKLLNSTNRFFDHKSKIPVVFESDSRYSFGNFVFSHFNTCIVFIAKKWYDSNTSIVKVISE